MTYERLADLPDIVRMLPIKGQRIWKGAYNRLGNDSAAWDVTTAKGFSDCRAKYAPVAPEPPPSRQPIGTPSSASGKTYRPMAVKFVDEELGIIEAIGAPYGGPMKSDGDRGQDLTHEDFGPDTDFCLDWFEHRPVLYHHGLDDGLKTAVIGRETKVEKRDGGIWFQAQLDKSAKYWESLKELIRQGKLFISSGSVAHLVEKDETGHIKRWPVVEWSTTPTPANPGAVIETFKAVAFLKTVGIDARTRLGSPESIKEEVMAPKTETPEAPELGRSPVERALKANGERTGVEKILDAAKEAGKKSLAGKTIAPTPPGGTGTVVETGKPSADSTEKVSRPTETVEPQKALKMARMTKVKALRDACMSYMSKKDFPPKAPPAQGGAPAPAPAPAPDPNNGADVELPPEVLEVLSDLREVCDMFLGSDHQEPDGDEPPEGAVEGKTVIKTEQQEPTAPHPATASPGDNLNGGNVGKPHPDPMKSAPDALKALLEGMERRQGESIKAIVDNAIKSVETKVDGLAQRIDVIEKEPTKRAPVIHTDVHAARNPRQEDEGGKGGELSEGELAEKLSAKTSDPALKTLLGRRSAVESVNEIMGNPQPLRPNRRG